MPELHGTGTGLVGGQFQGANDADFSSEVATLFTVSSVPPNGLMTVQNVANSNAFRYVRYLSPNGGYGNVAEVEFYGHPPVPTTPVRLSMQPDGNVLQFSWPSDYIGWRLETQTNEAKVGLGPYWFPVAGSSWTNALSIPANDENGSVFFRLIYP